MSRPPASLSRRSRWLLVLALGAPLAIAACEDEVVQPPPPSRGGQAAMSAALSASVVPSATAAPLSEGDFTASDSNRDPFRANFEQFAGTTSGTTVRRVQVLADRFSLDELKLVALVTGNAAPRAMFVDPEGKGWIISIGQLIGRAEIVKTGGTNGAEYELNWKVDRIRDNDVVFVRENPSRQGAIGATRVVALRAENDPGTQR